MGAILGSSVRNTYLSKILTLGVESGDREDFTEEVPLELRPAVSVSSPGKEN